MDSFCEDSPVAALLSSKNIVYVNLRYNGTGPRIHFNASYNTGGKLESANAPRQAKTSLRACTKCAYTDHPTQVQSMTRALALLSYVFSIL